MPVDLFLRGLAIGFAVAFALGPIGLLVIKRTIDRGWLYGFLSGTGVATADATYGAIAAFGLTAVSELLLGIDRWLGIIGGRAPALARAPCATPAAGRRGGGAAWTRPGPATRSPAGRPMVALTLTNPATILSFAALFGEHRRRERAARVARPPSWPASLRDRSRGGRSSLIVAASALA